MPSSLSLLSSIFLYSTLLLLLLSALHAAAAATADATTAAATAATTAAADAAFCLLDDAQRVVSAALRRSIRMFSFLCGIFTFFNCLPFSYAQRPFAYSMMHSVSCLWTWPL